MIIFSNFSSSNHHHRKSEAAIKVVDVMSTQWTDKKHSLYLDSMEASFVNQLYGSECRSKDLVGWLSRSPTCMKRSGSDPENQTFGQFKVLDRNFCELGRAENENESRPLSESQWIQHFRSHAISTKQHVSPPNEMENNELASQSIQLMDKSHGRQAKISNKSGQFVNHRYWQVSPVSMTEASDQNFVDTEAERVEKFSRRNSKKRARPSISPANDQVVPFVGQALDDETKENGEEFTPRVKGDAAS